MLKEFKILGLVLSGSILTLFALFVATQTNDVYQLANGVSEAFGSLVLYGLLAIYGIAIVIPFYLLLRMRAPLIPPAETSSRAREKFIRQIAKRFQSIDEFKGEVITNEEDIKRAISRLNKKANKVIENAATLTFVVTAVSQSGRLDSLFVLVTQSKMVWVIAHIYNQRPSLRDLFYLYSNVAFTTFAAYGLEEIDLEEYLAPAISEGLAIGTGLSTLSSVAAASVIEGSANAFLTLRIGIIARRYCGMLVPEKRAVIRKSAMGEATITLGKVLLMIGPSVVKSLTNFGTNAAKKGVGKVSSLVQRILKPDRATAK